MRRDDTIVAALTVDGVVRDVDLGGVIRPQCTLRGLPHPEERALARVSKDEHGGPRPRDLMVRDAQGALLTMRTHQLNLAGDVLLHPIGHLDQPPPRLLQKRHHPIHVAVARQRNFDFALTLGHLRLGLFE